MTPVSIEASVMAKALRSEFTELAEEGEGCTAMNQEVQESAWSGFFIVLWNGGLADEPPDLTSSFFGIFHRILLFFPFFFTLILDSHVDSWL